MQNLLKQSYVLLVIWSKNCTIRKCSLNLTNFTNNHKVAIKCISLNQITKCWKPTFSATRIRWMHIAVRLSRYTPVPTYFDRNLIIKSSFSMDFSNPNFVRKTVSFSVIWTQVVGVEDKHADHLTTTTVPWIIKSFSAYRLSRAANILFCQSVIFCKPPSFRERDDADL